MTVGIELGSITDEIGAASFFNAFFRLFLEILNLMGGEVVFP